MLASIANQFITFLRSIDFITRMFCIFGFILLSLWCVVKFIGANVQKTKISWLYFAITILLMTASVLLAVYD